MVHFPADWRRYGASAGPRRNRQMRDEGKPTEALCFHENLQGSRGSSGMARLLDEAGIPWRLVEWREGR